MLTHCITDKKPYVSRTVLYHPAGTVGGTVLQGLNIASLPHRNKELRQKGLNSRMPAVYSSGYSLIRCRWLVYGYVHVTAVYNKCHTNTNKIFTACFSLNGFA
jgi:hypothetical protein